MNLDVINTTSTLIIHIQIRGYEIQFIFTPKNPGIPLGQMPDKVRCYAEIYQSTCTKAKKGWIDTFRIKYII